MTNPKGTPVDLAALREALEALRADRDALLSIATETWAALCATRCMPQRDYHAGDCRIASEAIGTHIARGPYAAHRSALRALLPEGGK